MSRFALHGHLPMARPRITHVSVSAIISREDHQAHISYIATTGDYGCEALDPPTGRPQGLLIAKLRAVYLAMQKIQHDSLIFRLDSEEVLKYLDEWLRGGQDLPPQYYEHRGGREPALRKLATTLRKASDRYSIIHVADFRADPALRATYALAYLSLTVTEKKTKLKRDQVPQYAARKVHAALCL